MEPAALADRLGLGPLLRPATPLKDAERYLVWKAETPSGTWVMKTDRPWGDFWYGLAAQTGRLEAAAWKAGIPMAEPHFPETDEYGLWQPLGDGAFGKAARFLDGTHPDKPLAPPLAAWAGATVAALAALAVPVDDEVEGADHRLHPPHEWDEWLGQARDLGVLDAGQARDLKDAAVRIAAIAEAGRADEAPVLVMHRDMSHLNIMVAADGPALLDFDSAGPQEPWWELISVALELAGPDLGVMRPERRAFEDCVAGYADAGGRIGATDESAFVGVLLGRLSSTAWQLWMACGHRGGSAAMRAEMGRDLRASVVALTEMLAAAPTWASWLR
jgi:hypothetical protein